MRWLVIADDADRVAPWAFARLQASIAEPGALVTGEDLAQARWEYRLGDGDAAIVSLAGGQTLDARRLRWVLNRLSLPPTTALAGLGTDAPYARGEWHALLLAWLHELGRAVLNPPQPPSLIGPMLAHTQWLALAAKAGFQTQPISLDTHAVDAPPARLSEDIWIVGEHCFANAPVSGRNRQAAQALAGATHTPMLRIGIDEEGRFAGADPTPDLRLAGGAAIDMLARHAKERLA